MKQVYIMKNKETKETVAIYSDLNLLKQLKAAIEEKLEIETEIDAVSINPDIKSFS